MELVLIGKIDLFLSFFPISTNNFGNTGGAVEKEQDRTGEDKSEVVDWSPNSADNPVSSGESIFPTVGQVRQPFTKSVNVNKMNISCRLPEWL